MRSTLKTAIFIVIGVESGVEGKGGPWPLTLLGNLSKYFVFSRF